MKTDEEEVDAGEQCPTNSSFHFGQLPHRRRLGGCCAEKQDTAGRLRGADAALCSRMVYGVLQNQLLLDFYIGAFCSQRPDHLQPPLLEILRLGAYQILFLDKVPDHAAVSESVELAKLSKRGQAAGLVNAVLRKLSQNKHSLPPIPDHEQLRYLSIRYSHPRCLVKRLLSAIGPEETEAFLQINNSVAPLTIQINPMKTTAAQLRQS